MKTLIVGLAAVLCWTIYAGAQAPSGPLIQIRSDQKDVDARGRMRLSGNVEVAIDGSVITTSGTVTYDPSLMRFTFTDGTVTLLADHPRGVETYLKGRAPQ